MISHDKVPPNGWRFYEERTKTMIVGMSWNDLVKCIRVHRKSNGIPEDDIELDLAEYISLHHPELII